MNKKKLYVLTGSLLLLVFAIVFWRFILPKMKADTPVPAKNLTVDQNFNKNSVVAYNTNYELASISANTNIAANETASFSSQSYTNANPTWVDNSTPPSDSPNNLSTAVGSGTGFIRNSGTQVGNIKYNFALPLGSALPNDALINSVSFSVNFAQGASDSAVSFGSSASNTNTLGLTNLDYHGQPALCSNQASANATFPTNYQGANWNISSVSSGLWVNIYHQSSNCGSTQIVGITVTVNYTVNRASYATAGIIKQVGSVYDSTVQNAKWTQVGFVNGLTNSPNQTAITVRVCADNNPDKVLTNTSNCGQGTISNNATFLSTQPVGQYAQLQIFLSSNGLDTPSITQSVSLSYITTPPPTAAKYTISGSAGANGSISPATTTVTSGSNATLAASANDGYSVDSWSLDGKNVQTGGAAYVLTNVLANHTVNVTFKSLPAKPTVALSTAPASAVAPYQDVKITAVATAPKGFTISTITFYSGVDQKESIATCNNMSSCDIVQSVGRTTNFNAIATDNETPNISSNPAITQIVIDANLLPVVSSFTTSATEISSGSSVTLTASASKGASGVNVTGIFISTNGHELSKKCTFSSPAATGSCVYVPTFSSAGTYLFYAVATDTNGNMSKISDLEVDVTSAGISIGKSVTQEVITSGQYAGDIKMTVNGNFAPMKDLKLFFGNSASGTSLIGSKYLDGGYVPNIEKNQVSFYLSGTGISFIDTQAAKYYGGGKTIVPKFILEASDGTNTVDTDVQTLSSPQIAKIAGSVMPVSIIKGQQTEITVNGYAFGVDFSDNKVLNGAVELVLGSVRKLAAITYWDNTKIKMTVPADTNIGLYGVQVFRGYYADTSAGAANANSIYSNISVTPNALQITSVPTGIDFTPQNGTAGAIITITGQNFGGAQGSSYVNFLWTKDPGFNDINTPIAPLPVFVKTLPQVTSWNDSKITITVPSDITAKGNTPSLILDTAGQYQINLMINGVYYFAQNKYFTPLISDNSCATVKNSPTITSLSKLSGKIGDEITITGSGFGTDSKHNGYFSLGSMAARSTRWSDTSVTLKIPYGVSSFGNNYTWQFINTIGDKTLGDCSAKVSPFTVIDSNLSCSESVNSLSTPTPLEAGSEISIKGSDFGAKGAKSISLKDQSGNTINIDMINNWSDDNIDFVIPDGVQPFSYYTIEINSKLGSANCAFSVGPIEITGIIWTGGGSDNNWSNPDNWLGKTVPTKADQIYFLGTHGGIYPNGNKNADASNQKPIGAKLTISNDYSGTITFAGKTVFGVFAQSGGKVQAMNAEFHTSTFALSGTTNPPTFSAPAGTCSNSLTVNNCLFFEKVDGVNTKTYSPGFTTKDKAIFFNQGGETIVMADSLTNLSDTQSALTTFTFSPSSITTLDNLTFLNDDSGRAANMSTKVSGTLIINNNLTARNNASNNDPATDPTNLSMMISGLKATTKNLILDNGASLIAAKVKGGPIDFASGGAINVAGDISFITLNPFSLSSSGDIEIIGNSGSTSNITGSGIFGGNFTAKVPSKKILIQAGTFQEIKGNMIISDKTGKTDDMMTLKSDQSESCPANKPCPNLPIKACAGSNDPGCKFDYSKQAAVSVDGNADIQFAHISDMYNLGTKILTAKNSTDDCFNSNWGDITPPKPAVTPAAAIKTAAITAGQTVQSAADTVSQSILNLWNSVTGQ